jgi:flagellar motor switch protein FliG
LRLQKGETMNNQNQASNISSQSMTFIEKAAALMVSLESQSPGVTNKIFSYIGEARSKKLLKAISKLKKIDFALKSHINEEFYELAIEKRVVFGGKTVTEKILKESFGISSQDEYLSEKTGLFEFVKLVDDSRLLSYFETENDQVIALLLYYMGDERVARLLSKLSPEQSSSLTQKVIGCDVPSAQLLWRFHHRLEQLLMDNKIDIDAAGNEDQYKKLARALETMLPDSREMVLGHLNVSNKELADTISKFIITFEDFEKMSDKDMQSLLYNIEQLKTLAIALKDVSESFKTKINDNISERVHLMLEEEEDTLPDILPENSVSEAQNEIVQIARRLEKEKKIAPLYKLMEEGE